MSLWILVPLELIAFAVAYLVIGFVCAYWLSWLNPDYLYNDDAWKREVDPVIARCVMLIWPIMILVRLCFFIWDHADPYTLVAKARSYTEKRRLKNSDMD